MANEKVAAAFERLKEAIDRGIDQIEKGGPEKQEIDSAVETAVINKIQPIVRQMLAANLAASGLKKRSGSLEQAVKQADVFIQRGRRGAKLVVGFKAGVKAPKGNVYIYGAAQNYGAVHHPTPIGGFPGRHGRKLARANRALKKRAYRQLRSRKALFDRARFRTTRRGQIHIGTGTFITQPRNFFKLNPAQEQQIATLFMTLLREETEARRKQ